MARYVEIQQLIDQVMGARAAFGGQHRFDGLQPFARFLWIVVESYCVVRVHVRLQGVRLSTCGLLVEGDWARCKVIAIATT
ncbi:hypothetical protein H097_13438 [Pseudomonas sp. FH4]|uniref:hypothetical protein n=1 Tax=Pseudomonas sp. FH4 TaxID=1284393 RepID=UPI0003DC1045|nr:hypothetical protein [Pseudomonas sp. FH4]ETK18311.1 hypothetical protein H097_13438 [Pseudomonas sp. FH4]